MFSVMTTLIITTVSVPFRPFCGPYAKISTLKQIFMKATIQWPKKYLKMIDIHNLKNLFSMLYFISFHTKGAAVQVRGVDRLGWRAGLGLACRHTAPQHRNHQPENYLWLLVHLHIFTRADFVRVQRSSAGIALTCCKAGPGLNQHPREDFPSARRNNEENVEMPRRKKTD